MNTVKAILVGAIIWLGGVSAYTLSYFIPIVEDIELQANTALAIGLIPIAWLGARFYFKKENPIHGFRVAAIMVLTAVILDAIITVPFLIIPYGGSYLGFFTGFSFWLIATEYLAVITLYSRMKASRQTLKNQIINQ